MTCSTYIEEVVDTSPLLQKVDCNTEEGAVHQSWNAAWLAGEALHPAALANLVLFRDDAIHLLVVTFYERIVWIILHSSKSS